MAQAVAFHARARRDVKREWHYLFTKSGVRAADALLESLEATTVMLLLTPQAGMACNFSSPRAAAVRRFPLHLPYGTWMIFYAPTARGITVYCIIHGARDLTGLFN